MARIAYRYGLLVVLVGLVVFFSASKPRFREWDNALIIFQSVAIVAIVALGVTVSMAAGGFDLSVGANVSFVVMVTALVMIRYDLSGVAAIVAGLLAGLLVAAVNSVLIVVARVPDLVATLGTLFIFQGLALIITSGKSVSVGMPIGDGNVATGQFAAGTASWATGRSSRSPFPSCSCWSSPCSRTCSWPTLGGAERCTPSVATRPQPGSRGYPSSDTAPSPT